MRLYRNLVAASINALQKIFSQNKLADQVVQSTLRSNKKWGSKDRRFLAATIYNAVRWYRLYYEVYGKEPKTTNHWWHILGIMWLIEGNELPPWEEFAELDNKHIENRYREISKIRKIKEAIPDWLDELGLYELGDRWEECIKALNKTAQLVLRANTLKTSRMGFVNELKSKGIYTQLLDIPAGVVVPERRKLTNMPSYERGYFEIQDASSQKVAPFLEVEKGMYVVDACAGAGGKSLHIAALMENRGRILSLDVDNDRLCQLKKRAKRAAVTILKTQLIKSKKSILQLHDLADRLLLDVPCSGLGTLRRSPHIKWRLTPKLLKKTLSKQQQILQDYAPICKQGGKIVYATCSILPCENHEQIKTFLNSSVGAGFTLVREQVILPQEEGFDGFYMALMERKATSLGSWD
ncbi:MAG: RsmB/NOP family class I SAM-dependent RNA methyltransferase [Saprospiraceae bacterium]|nr:RsmB/NOP family class I SAM-dependent RNA methyltransferase [Saprospiraceae bacterium]